MKKAILIVLMFAFSRDAIGQSSKTETEIARLHDALAAYFKEYDRLPDGNSAAILQSLAGSNPRRHIFFEFSTGRPGTNATFVDTWQTPFRITTSKGKSAEVRSAGPDRQFGTSDDISKSRSF